MKAEQIYDEAYADEAYLYSAMWERFSYILMRNNDYELWTKYLIAGLVNDGTDQA